MPRRRHSASNSADLAIPKPETAKARRLREDAEFVIRRGELRARVLAEDGGVCRRCEWRARRGLQAQPRQLQLHTDNPARLAHVHEALLFRSGTGRKTRDEAALDPRNNITLCWQCHGVVQGNREDVVPLDPARGCRGAVEFRPHERGRRRELRNATLTPTGNDHCARCGAPPPLVSVEGDPNLFCSDCATWSGFAEAR